MGNGDVVSRSWLRIKADTADAINRESIMAPQREVQMSIPVPKIRELHYMFTTKSHGRVVAHCLDLDIVTAANDIQEAEKRLDLLTALHIEEALSTGNYAALSTAAPSRYWNDFNQAFRSGMVHKMSNPTLTVRVPDVVPLEHTQSSIGVLAAAMTQA